MTLFLLTIAVILFFAAGALQIPVLAFLSVIAGMFAVFSFFDTASLTRW